MHIDVPVILTTVIGFLIVVWILKKYAWGPVLDLLDARREKIRGDFAAADQARDQAAQLKQEFEVQLSSIKVIEKERVQEAVKRGEDLAGRIQQEARQKADATLDKARTDIEVETRNAQVELKDQVVDLAIGAAEKLIGKSLDEPTHRKLVEDYIAKLGETPNA